MHADNEELGPADSTVQVYMGDIEIHQFPDDVELSTRGIRFRSEHALETFSIVEMSLDLPEKPDDTEVSCAGMVVECTPLEDSTEYSVLVKFLPVPATSGKFIDKAVENSAFKCPFQKMAS